jgi:hypothetical protein
MKVLELDDEEKEAEAIKLAKSDLGDRATPLGMFLNNCIFLAASGTWEDGLASYNTFSFKQRLPPNKMQRSPPSR